MLSLFKLIKIDSLILLALAQISIKYGILRPFNIPFTLNSFGFSLLVLSSVCLLAAGNVIIAINNKELSKYRISEKNAFRWFIGLNCIGVILGFYLSNLIQRPGFIALFIITSGLFYMYSTYIREYLVVKNLIIALLAALSIIVIAIFELLPLITEKNKDSIKIVFSIITDYAVFGFIIILIIELVKDCIHLDRDHNLGLKTIPTVLGKDRSLKLVGLLGVLSIAAVIYYMYTYLFSSTKAVIIVLIIIVAPLLFFIIKSFNADKTKDIRIMKLLLQLVIFTSATTLLALPYIIQKV